MKFKAVLTDRGLNVLHRGFLPTLEKFGKHCLLLLSPEDVHLVMGPSDADGLVVTARIANVVLFDPERFNCKSRQADNIAVSVEIGLLMKVLKAAASHAAEQLDMKLAMRPLGSAIGGADRPVLSFSWRGQHMTMVQDLPISQPLQAGQLGEALRLRDVSQLCDYYLDAQPEAVRLQVGW